MFVINSEAKLGIPEIGRKLERVPICSAKALFLFCAENHALRLALQIKLRAMIYLIVNIDSNKLSRQWKIMNE